MEVFANRRDSWPRWIEHVDQTGVVWQYYYSVKERFGSLYSVLFEELVGLIVGA